MAIGCLNSSHAGSVDVSSMGDIEETEDFSLQELVFGDLDIPEGERILGDDYGILQ